MTATDSIAIGTPKAAASLELPWEELEESEETTVSDVGAEFDGVKGGLPAEVVIRAEDVSRPGSWGHISNA